MEMLSKLNSPVLYLICSGIILFVAVICIVFAVRAYRMGKAMGIDTTKMRRVIKRIKGTALFLPSCSPSGKRTISKAQKNQFASFL